jgi:hypothetical protein
MNHAPQTIEKQGFAAVKLDVLLRLPTLDSLTDTELVNVQKLACLNPNDPAPSIETILHAIIPYVFVDHTHADAVCAVTNSPDGEAFIREIYGDKALIVPYCMPGFVLAKEVKKLTVGVDWEKIEVIILLNHGIFTWGNDAKTSYKRMVEKVNRAEEFLKTKKAYFESLESGHEAREKFDPVPLAPTRPPPVRIPCTPLRRFARCHCRRHSAAADSDSAPLRDAPRRSFPRSVSVLMRHQRPRRTPLRRLLLNEAAAHAPVNPPVCHEIARRSDGECAVCGTARCGAGQVRGAAEGRERDGGSAHDPAGQ